MRPQARKFYGIFSKLPLRLKGVILCILFVVPLMLLARKIFPPEDQGTILIIVCFFVAAVYAFFGMGGRKRA